MIRKVILPWLLVSGVLWNVDVLVAEKQQHKYCIIGAGPAGLQLAYELHRASRDYVVLERNARAGSFFEQFPRHGTLISINKRFTSTKNTEFNFRHDWNSLLSDQPQLLFSQYSNQLFPQRQGLVRYLEDFHRQLQLHITFNASIVNVRRLDNSDENRFEVMATDQRQWICQVLILATGFTPKTINSKYSDKILFYHNMTLNRKYFTDKRVLIVGKGNSAFETATAIQDETAYTHLISSSRLRLAWSTHYVGDLRAVNNALLDTYQLKSLDALLDDKVEHLNLQYDENRKVFTFTDEMLDFSETEMKERSVYDIVIYCIGWLFDTTPFRDINIRLSKRKKYPRIKANHESSDQPHVFVIGTASHGLDWRKSSGGFIHGFRYTTRSLARLLNVRYENSRWPAIQGSLLNLGLVNHIIKRLNEAASLYQMFGILADVIIINKTMLSYTYLEDYPIKSLAQLGENSGFENETNRTDFSMFVVMLELGKNFSGPAKDVFREDRINLDEHYAWKCNFLHPVIYYYTSLPKEKSMAEKISTTLPKPKAIIHLIEDLHTHFRKRSSFVIPLTAFMETQLNMNITMEPITLQKSSLQSLLYQSNKIKANQMAIEWPLDKHQVALPLVEGFDVARFW